jgi:hypothetical protein
VRFLTVLSLFLVPTVLFAHTDARFYRGDITVSTSWEGVIRPTGTVVIREGITVTVEPGTEILVQPGVGAEIIVRGRFLVRGVPGKPVLFDAAGGCGAGSWGGILFERGSKGVLENASVRCSEKGVAGDLTGVTRAGVTVERAR